MTIVFYNNQNDVRSTPSAVALLVPWFVRQPRHLLRPAPIQELTFIAQFAFADFRALTLTASKERGQLMSTTITRPIRTCELVNRLNISGFDSSFTTSYTTRGNATGTTNYC